MKETQRCYLCIGRRMDKGIGRHPGLWPMGARSSLAGSDLIAYGELIGRIKEGLVLLIVLELRGCTKDSQESRNKKRTELEE